MPLRFLVAGFTRCGTTYFHEQLRRHPQIWLPPQKELHYFTVERKHRLFNRKRARHLQNLGKDLREALRDNKRSKLGALGWQLRFHLGRRSDEWFRSLGEVPLPLVTGMTEPTYARMPLGEIRQLHALEPNARLIFIMRDPLERAWSSLTKSQAMNLGRPMEEVPKADLVGKLYRSTLTLSKYIEHIERWNQVWPSERIHFGYYEDLAQRPREFLDSVFAFLELDPFPPGNDEALFDLVNDTRGYRTKIPEYWARELSKLLVEPTRRLADRFGGLTLDWLKKQEAAIAANPEPDQPRPL